MILASHLYLYEKYMKFNLLNNLHTYELASLTLFTRHTCFYDVFLNTLILNLDPLSDTLNVILSDC